jgi:hypothetical protein
MHATATRAIASFRTRVKKHKTGKDKYGFVMSEFKAGRLFSSAGYKVTNPSQARAIAFSMAISHKPKAARKKIYKKIASKLKKAMR